MLCTYQSIKKRLYIDKRTIIRSFQHVHYLKMCLLNIVLAFLAFLLILIGYLKWSYQYWSRRGLFYLTPKIPFGNFEDVLKGKEHKGTALKRFYNEMKKKGWKHGGIYTMLSPVYLPIDLNLIKDILIKDFHFFADRNIYFNEKDDPLSANLINIDGSKWNILRKKSNPLFTSGKIRMMFDTFLECGDKLRQRMEVECLENRPINLKNFVQMFTTDVIGRCAFGLDLKSFESEYSPFKIFGKKVLTLNTIQKYKRLFGVTFPKLARFLRMTVFPQDVAKFFLKLVHDTVEYRDKNGYTDNDFMQQLIDLKNNRFVVENGEKNNYNLTLNEMAAQCFLFFLGATDTTPLHMCLTLYELAKNQRIQEKLRSEISTVLAQYDGKITYEAIQNMEYLDQVIQESLRKYPPAPYTNRKCSKDYKIPNENIVIQKGTTVYIPILAIHHDEEYYPDPEKFDPERFTKENKNLRHNFAYIPFGDGPRACIGKRFALTMVKAAFTSLLKSYTFTVNQMTEEPLKFKNSYQSLTLNGDIWLNVHKDDCIDYTM